MSLSGDVAYCPEECSAWIFKYLKDCICSPKDQVSFVFGMLSVASWGVAEVPQIVTHFREQSTDGLSLAFLVTWVVGDLFNLGGCYLEPATLPTQFYMALLYTITTCILVGQVIYYGHFYSRGKEEDKEPVSPTTVEEDGKVSLLKALAIPETTEEARGTKQPSPGSKPQTTVIHVPVSRQSSSRDLHFTSARSFASSNTPTNSYLFGSMGWGSGGHSIPEQNNLLPNASSYGSLTTSHRGSSVPRPHRFSSDAALRVVGSGVLMLGGLGFRSGLIGKHVKDLHRGIGSYKGRKLLQHVSLIKFGTGNGLPQEGGADSMLGEIFGWCMAAIYMGGRLPQIWLNMTRGTVEGLHPLMFLFALMGNLFYVGSIVVRSTEWEKLKPNMAWLVDAGVCVLLDLFILNQFMYYWWKVKRATAADERGEYKFLT